jgi:endonuclease/exonuclease/phosphatase family metal-dependent hydrolase
MHRFLILCLINFFIFTSLLCQDIDLMTYNIRYNNPNDGANQWNNRKEVLLSQINYYQPGVLGTQEGLIDQVKWLDEKLESYSYVGVGRADIKEEGEGELCAIFYDKKKFSNILSNTFWLSDQPESPSRGWDASLNRICTYILLEEIETNQKFWVFNTHFDHMGQKAREKSAEVILHHIDSLNFDEYPLFLMGDFNLEPNKQPIKNISQILNDSRYASQNSPFGPEGTFCGFDVCDSVKGRIDYIFSSKDNILINQYAVISDVIKLKYPSDHLPVLIRAELKGTSN